MKFLVFAYADYYPSGGWGDFQGSFVSPEEAKDHARICKNTYHNVEVVRLSDETVVFRIGYRGEWSKAE